MILNEKNKKLSVILKNISQATDGTSSEDVLKNFIKELHNSANYYLTVLWIAEEGQEEKLKLFAQYGLSDSGIQKFEANFPTSGKILKAIDQGDMIIEEISALEPSPLKTFLMEEGVFAVVEIPFFRNSRLYGVLEIYLKGKEDITEPNKHFFCNISVALTTLGNIFNIKLSNNEEIERIKQVEKETTIKLEEKIKIQNRELSDLRKFQELTIGRELVMTELKNKIKQLEKQLEERNKSAS